MKNEKTFRPDRIFSYFRVEWVPLAFVTLSGLIYNIGLLATTLVRCRSGCPPLCQQHQPPDEGHPLR